MNFRQVWEALFKSLNMFYQNLPILFALIFLLGFVVSILPNLSILFNGNPFLDGLIGAFMGSIFAGNPVNSYILGGELLGTGISLFVVSAFLFTWVTVGIVQLPAESLMLGKRFSLIRNGTAFLLSFILAFILCFLIGAF